MVKLTQTIRRLLPTNFLSVFDHFVGLSLKGLMLSVGQPFGKNNSLSLLSSNMRRILYYVCPSIGDSEVPIN